MADQTEYYLDPSQRLLNLMKETFGSQYTYFLGAPTDIPNEAYPCFVIQPVRAQTNSANTPTGADDVGEEINIEVQFDSKDDLKAPADADTTMRRLYQLIQGRSPADGSWLPNTVMGAIRKNFTLETTIIDQDVDINYDVQQRFNSTTILMGIVTIVVRERIYVGTRT